ncbi:hypothetical protein CHLRE_13g607550v5 [Chlamydomonas reinhardtii]|uniref:Uncharacterized protein n=1 Tax=Chlamydomonas reinhardtii TaxID=3055 RepID=A0A2K3D1K4_CHLRE|nr:uncharacterized protein CHLRE_13g607550v5 [Chlamydomonas reinhardtii]PNW74412.1 hypothetical protein CHLRE_13g607550v5 [Chlamydomonas reinhardtii]
MPQKPSVSTELTLGDDSTTAQPFSHGDSDAAAGSDPVTAAVAAAAGSLPPISLEKWEEPPEWLKQVNRGAGIMFNSGVVALLRAYMNPPPPTVVPEPGTPGVPEWFTEEYEQRTRGRRLAARVARDTAVFMAGCYIMDWVDSAMEKIRGVKDPMNKVMGGIAAGGLIGFSWYPLDPRARALVTLCGGAVGFVTHVTDTASTAYLLAQQRSLEKKLLHKPDAELKTEMNPYYLRALIRAQQLRELQIARKAAAQIDALDSITANPNPNAPTRPPSFAASGITAAGSSGSTSGSGSGSGNDRGVLVINEDAGSPTEEPKQDEEAAASSGSGAQQRRR